MDAGPLPEAVLGISRSVTGRRWVWREADARTAMAIAQRAELPELVGRLLAARGVGIEAVTDFLEPTLRALLPDPSILRDMDVAAARLASVFFATTNSTPDSRLRRLRSVLLATSIPW